MTDALNTVPVCLSNVGWRFRFGDDTAWQSVELPHTWNATDTMDTNLERHYRRGTGVYELDFSPPEILHGRRLWVEFEAVSQRAKVYFDEVLLAEHHGGYTAFTVEIPNRAGVLRIEADNTSDPDLIPSDMSDFFLYGGITRDVWLYSSGETRIEQLFFDIDVTDDLAELEVRGRLSDSPIALLTLHIALFDRQTDENVFTAAFDVRSTEFSFRLPSVEKPHLWSPDDPYLYRAEAVLMHDDKWCHDVHMPIGFRHFEFPEGGPFYLNGKRLLLRGTHRHDDWAGYGSAVPIALVKQELQQIKEAGFNFIRLGHYPQSSAVLDLCDQLGLILWEELPWCRGGVGGAIFKQHARNMLREMIEQHYHHPSIVFWGLGNELDWESEHPDFTEADVIEFLRELQELTRKQDATRLTAVRRFEPAKDIVDVVSPSIWSGWYRGRYEDYEAALTAEMRHYPRMLHIEWGGDSHVGRHNDGPHIATEIEQTTDHGEIPGTATSNEGFSRYSRDGDWSESYIIDLMAHHLAVQETVSNFAGGAQWVFKDFGTPLRPENPMPYINQKGLVARDSTPKDAYYVFQAFQSDQPVVRIESSAWEVRVGDQRVPQTIRVITNCQRVELSIDGKTFEKKALGHPQAGVLMWQVPLTYGVHTIEAVGYCGETACAQHTVTQRFEYGNCGAVADLQIFTETDGAETCIVCQLVDDDGYPVTVDERRVCFEAISGVTLVTDQGTMGGSTIVETANGRAWIGCTIDDITNASVKVQVEGMFAVEYLLS